MYNTISFAWMQRLLRKVHCDSVQNANFPATALSDTEWYEKVRMLWAILSVGGKMWKDGYL